MLAGDLNAHSRRWDPRGKEQRDVTTWQEIIAEHGMEFGNDDQPTHHWARNGEESESTIDLTLASRPITRWTILDWRHAPGSDHEVIEREFSVDTQDEADHVQVMGWNLAAMSQEDEKAVEKLWNELEGQRARLDEECTGDEVEREAECCQETLSKVLDAKVTKKESEPSRRGGGTVRYTRGEAHSGERKAWEGGQKRQRTQKRNCRGRFASPSAACRTIAC